MRTVPIEIFVVAKTQVDHGEVANWLRALGVSQDFLNELRDNAVAGDDAITNPALLIALAAKQCYMAFEPGMNPNVNKVRKDWTDYLDNILASGHGSVLEHAVYSFAIKGVSRVFTGEMNRHRAGVAISEQSMRFIRYEDIPYWLPTSITTTPEEDAVVEELGPWAGKEGNNLKEDNMYPIYKLAMKKLRSQSVFANAFKQMEENYRELESIWAEELAKDSKFSAKKHVTSMMRRIIGMGVATGGVWTLNLRAVRHIMALRSSSAAEEEILHVFSRIVQIMMKSEPMLCGDFHQDAQGYWVPKYNKV